MRAFDFPRLQIGLGAALCSAVLVARYRSLSSSDRRWLGASLAAALLQGAHIFPYTRFARKEVLSTGGEPDLRILTANVLQGNRCAEGYRKLIDAVDPHIILLTEVNARWERDMSFLEHHYRFVVRRPLENTYGMILYSKLALIGPEVRFLVKQDIPSIKTRVGLPNGRTIWLYAVHPEPPGTLRPDSTIRGSGPRDVELLQLAEELAKQNEPIVVVGDFNDVAWSHTTRLFKRLSRLLDPRCGRGMFNTFHADYPPLRYPLDHLFHSEHFLVADFRRLPRTGSDHFPIFAALKLSEVAPKLQEQATPRASDFAEADETLRNASTD